MTTKTSTFCTWIKQVKDCDTYLACPLEWHCIRSFPRFMAMGYIQYYLLYFSSRFLTGCPDLKSTDVRLQPNQWVQAMGGRTLRRKEDKTGRQKCGWQLAHCFWTLLPSNTSFPSQWWELLWTTLLSSIHIAPDHTISNSTTKTHPEPKSCNQQSYILAALFTGNYLLTSCTYHSSTPYDPQN